MRIIWANKTTTRELNRAPEDLVGQTCYRVFYDNDAPCALCPSTKAATSGKIEHSIIHHQKSKGIEGETYWDNYAVPIKNDSGDVINLIQITRNITEQVQGELALRERKKELKIKTANLEEMNIAMKVLLKKQEEERIELEENIFYNVKELIEPYLEKLKNSKLDEKQKAYLDMLESNLNEIVSPFAFKLDKEHLNMTPAEIQVSDLIRYGKSSKEIADFLNLSKRTIDSHRASIRKKLNIKNKKSNLRTYLSAIK